MDRLPPELHDRIISFAVASPRRAGFAPPQPAGSNTHRLSPLSTLSRWWQTSVERRAFRNLSITNDDLDDLDRIVTPWRRHYVRELHLTVKFPDYDDKLSREYETNEERAANNAIATSDVKRLFSILGTWEVYEDHELKLHLSFTSPGDKVMDDETGWPTSRGIEEKRYQYSFVQLDSVEDFDEVPCVTMLAEPNGTRTVDLSTWYTLTSRLPRVNCAIWDTVEAGRFVRLRQELRDRFVLAVESNARRIPPVLQVTVEAPIIYHEEPLPNLTAPVAYDRLSSVFRQLSLGLTEFHFSGIAEHTLLWPSPTEAHVSEPRWQNLTSLNVELSLQSPSGRWYFKSKEGPSPSDVPIPDGTPGFLPPGYYETEDENVDAMEYTEFLDTPLSVRGRGSPADEDFRTWPDNEVMAPLLASFAKAIGAMPSLRFAQLQFWHSSLRSPFYLVYAPPGSLAGDEDYLPEEERPPGTAPRVLAHTWKWKMDDELDGFFRKAGQSLHGVDTAVRYLPDIYAD